eukprot:3789449-Rhodomonas_salina.1
MLRWFPRCTCLRRKLQTTTTSGRHSPRWSTSTAKSSWQASQKDAACVNWCIVGLTASHGLSRCIVKRQQSAAAS